jgi:hypothetical protein
VSDRSGRLSRLSESLSPYLPDGSSTGTEKISISLPADLLAQVRTTARERGTTVSATIAAALRLAIAGERPSDESPVDPAVGDWLVANDVRLRAVADDDWRRRLDRFLEDRRALAAREGWSAKGVAADVDAAVAEVRGTRAAGGR